MCTVVVVDDHPGFRRTVRRLLERGGCQVVGEAPDVESALRLLRDVHPSFVLLDVTLPDGDGFQLLRTLRSTGDSTPVVLISSRDRRSYAGSLPTADVAGFFLKSELDMASLTALLERP
jgi:DNA-binding NarL/FixJ family response regulator